jgi:electron transport complex protein RnfC
LSVFKLWSFHGGVHLHRHAEDTRHGLPASPPLPGRLIFPLHQRGGINATASVVPGDKVLKGQVIADGAHPLGTPLHASSSGVVRAIEKQPLPQRSGGTAPCIVIDTDGADRAVQFRGIADYVRRPPAELRERIRKAGIVDLGGGGFPTFAKLDPGPRHIDTLILNAAECEPHVTCDDGLLRAAPEAVLEGANVLLHILSAERCLIGVGEDMPEAIAALETARRKGDYGRVRIVAVPAIYPAGSEKQLIRTLTGREVPTEGIPADRGVICQNVGTAAAVYRAVVHGEPLMSRIVTVTGQGIRRPQNLIVRLGTPVSDLIRHCGGDPSRAMRLIMGGPMTGFALSGDALPVVPSTNCIRVADQYETTGPEEAMPCIRCGECANVCPANLLPQQLYWHSRADDLGKAQLHGLQHCIECGCCDVVCPSHIPLVSSFRAAKEKLHAKQRSQQKADLARLRHQARLARKEREKAEHEEAVQRRKAALREGRGAAIQDLIDRAKSRRMEPGGES